VSSSPTAPESTDSVSTAPKPRAGSPNTAADRPVDNAALLAAEGLPDDLREGPLTDTEENPARISGSTPMPRARELPSVHGDVIVRSESGGHR
jgi:hypothetical protein